MFDDSSNVQFPWKLHVLIEGAERNGYGHIISWLPAGNAFKVHDKVAFAEVLMPKYFHSNKYKSFQRNLNLWCFQTLTKEPNKGAIFHSHFLRGVPDRCHLMRRVKVKKNSQRMSLAEVRASAPQVALPSTSSLLASVDFNAIAPSASSMQMSELNAAQLVLLAHQQDNVQKQLQQQQNQLQQRQNLVQQLALLSGSHATQSSLQTSLLHNMSSPATQPTKLAASTSTLNALLLNHMAQNQAQAPSLMTPTAGTGTTSSLELQRIKMQISLALLVNNNNGPGNNMYSGTGIAALLPTNQAASSK